MPGNCETCCENINDGVRKRRTLLCSLFWILIFLSFIIQVIKYYNSSNVQPSKNDKTWDYLMFVQTWPVTFCTYSFGNQKNSTDKCSIAKIDGRPHWTIHGIWPSRSFSRTPYNNCNLIPFNVTELEPILNELKVSWASADATKPTTSFWKHEWSRHGTCGVQSGRLNTTFKYFNQGLDWYRQYNVDKTLDKCDIRPDDSKSYTNAQVVDCFKKHFDAAPRIACQIDKKRKKQLLYEVRLCFDSNLTLKSCDIFDTIEKDCKDFIYAASFPFNE